MAVNPARSFRLPRIAYLVVFFLAVGVTPFVVHPFLAVVYLLPILAIVFIRRTGTVVDERGITVRAVFGSRMLQWTGLTGLSVTGRNVYAVDAEGAVRLPCVRLSDLAALSAASGGAVPQLAEATPKYAPSSRRRR